MKYVFDADKFSRQLKTKRIIEINVGLRDVQKSTKVSAATLSRLENGATPDMSVFIKLCIWLKVSPSEFFYTQYKPLTKSTKASKNGR